MRTNEDLDAYRRAHPVYSVNQYAAREQRLDKLCNEEEERRMRITKTTDTTVDDWFAGAEERAYDGPFERQFASGMLIEVSRDGTVVIAMPREKGEHLGPGVAASRIVLCAEHVAQAKEWLAKTLSYLDKRQARLNADQT